MQMSVLPACGLSLPITGRYIPVMRSEAPALMPIFRSQHQAALLAWLLLHPEDEYTLTELAKKLDVPLTTLQREAQRLVGAGILQGPHPRPGKAPARKPEQPGRSATHPAPAGHLRTGDGHR